MSDSRLIARPAFAGLASPSPRAPDGGAPGVTVEERSGFTLMGIAARKGQAAALAEIMRRVYRIETPTTPRRITAEGLAILWAGPDQWFVLAEETAADWEEELRQQLSAVASITDQSDGRAILRVSGRKARAALAKGLPIDLHPRAFKPGDVAITAAAHIGVHLWQLDEAPTYELAVFRGFAESFFTWLVASGAEYGVRFTLAGR